ncbi:MAG TPA: hypothetical protein VGR51_09925 [Thermoplasmata archaeon]|nr:hypothetical protein [Thermoplasmata archaeon]
MQPTNGRDALQLRRRSLQRVQGPLHLQRLPPHLVRLPLQPQQGLHRPP